MSTRILARLIFSSSKLTVGIENVTLSRIPLRYYLDSVTVILMAPVSSNVCYVTCSHGTDCHEESPAGRVSVSKWLNTVGPNHPSNVAFRLFLDFLVSLAPNFTGSLRKVSS